MGRPRKYGESGLTADLRIPVTPEQKQLIAEAIALDGIDMAAWARPILLQAAIDRLAKETGKRPKRIEDRK